MISEKEKISRLLSYKNLLIRLKSLGFIRVFSDNLADTLGVSASLIRKDFSYFGITGNQRGGYHIDTVLEKIQELIGFENIQKVALIGVGHIGKALIQYQGFKIENIEITAGFDIDRNKTDESGNPPIFHIEKFCEYVNTNNIMIAILAVPDSVAHSVLELIQKTKIEGVLNFTPIELKSTDNLKVRNIDIKQELANLIYQVRK
ncbi:MAG: redox-sensing transcriptional repressor Rex [Prolixibacteraceae bacterium]|nr:redox-sensing transcriptional repressor Rex [Prolixibacteraceae bacterium]